MSKEKILLLTLAVIQFSHIPDFMIFDAIRPSIDGSFFHRSKSICLIGFHLHFFRRNIRFIGAFFIDQFDRRKAIITMATGFALGTKLVVLHRVTIGCFYTLSHRAVRRCYGRIDSLYN